MLTFRELALLSLLTFSVQMQCAVFITLPFVSRCLGTRVNIPRTATVPVHCTKNTCICFRLASGTRTHEVCLQIPRRVSTLHMNKCITSVHYKTKLTHTCTCAVAGVTEEEIASVVLNYSLQHSHCNLTVFN